MNKNRLMNKVVEGISYYARRQRKLKKVNEDIDKYMKMSDSEFIMDYTEVCSRYEHKKLIFITLLIGIIISIIMNTWNYFYKFLIVIFTSKNTAVADEQQLVVILLLIIILTISLVILFILYSMVKTIYIFNRKRIFLRQIKDMRKNDVNK